MNQRLAFFVSLLALGLAVANTFWLQSVASTNSKIVDRQNAALCAFRQDLGKRRDASLDYLEQHPEGAPALGLDRADLVRSISSQTSTLAALRPLVCPL